MMFSYDGAYALPGVRTQVETVENQFWWDKREKQDYFPVVIGGASRDVGNTSYTQILRGGLLLGRVTSTGKLKEWNPTGTDGSQYIFGVLDLPQNMQRLGTNQDRFLGHVLIRGMVKPDRLIIPGETTYGIGSEDYEHVIRYQLYQRGILLTDSTYGLAKPNPHGGWLDIVAKTADYTITEADNNILFTNEGASGAVILTLPTTAKKGLRYGLYVAAGQNLKFTSGTADKMITFNDDAADSVGFETASELIGGYLEVFGTGTKWLTIAHAYGLGATAQTVTVAT